MKMKTLHIYDQDGREIEVMRERADICLRHVAKLFLGGRCAYWKWEE